MDNYQMPVKAIKRIMREEINGKFDQMYKTGDRDLLSACRDNVLSDLENCNDYPSLEWFSGRYYRMSLSEWIESL